MCPLRDGARLVRIDERHRHYGRRPSSPFGLDRHRYALRGAIRREPAIADVLPEPWRVDRRRDLPDLLRVLERGPLHVAELGEGGPVELDAVDPSGDALVPDPAEGRDR